MVDVGGLEGLGLYILDGVEERLAGRLESVHAFPARAEPDLKGRRAVGAGEGRVVVVGSVIGGREVSE